MAPESRVLDIPTPNDTIETAHQPLELTQVAAFADWLDDELESLEAKFRRFCVRRKFLPNFRS